MIYNTPPEFYFRLHHVRPRFKNNVEQVVLYVADAICSAEIQSKNDCHYKRWEIHSKREFS